MIKIGQNSVNLVLEWPLKENPFSYFQCLKFAFLSRDSKTSLSFAQVACRQSSSMMLFDMLNTSEACKIDVVFLKKCVKIQQS